MLSHPLLTVQVRINYKKEKNQKADGKNHEDDRLVLPDVPQKFY